MFWVVFNLVAAAFCFGTSYISHLEKEKGCTIYFALMGIFNMLVSYLNLWMLR